MKRTLLFMVCVLASLTMLAQSEQNDYIPFVELGKQWHVVSNPSYPYSPSRFERYLMTEEVEIDGKKYVHTYLINDEQATSKDIGLFREEDRRVYKYNAKTGKDIMMYDFSLKEGDSFTYEYESSQPENCKVLKQGWLEDGPKIASLGTLSADTLEFNYRRLRTWIIGVDNGSGNYYEATTWVEGVGALMNVFNNPFADGGVSSLAYVEREDDETGYDKNDYLPFSSYNMYGLVHGNDLPTDEAESSENDGHHHLTYEMEVDRLHVYGEVLTRGGRNNYAYFIEKRTDDPMVRKIEFEIREVEPTMDCWAFHTTNFYVPGFDPKMNYIIVDYAGEHPVINKTPQNEYRPFIEDGKLWAIKVTSSWPTEEWMEYCYLEGDTIVNGQKGKRMLCDKVYTNESENIYGKYMGVFFEQDKKVYYSCYNGGIQFDYIQLYDFTLSSGDSIIAHDGTILAVTKLSGGIPGFKGTYYDLGGKERWFEGVGAGVWPWVNHPWGFNGYMPTLLYCCVGDEVIYYNSAVEDPYDMEAPKHRFDFTHTTKTQPKTPRRSEEEQSLYGEYNKQLLAINLDPIDEAYLVRITDETGNVIYEKAINAGNIVALNIDISAYAAGLYTVTVENSSESFTGEFEVQTTGIRDALRLKNNEEIKNKIYNLQGQRLSTLQRGLNIVNGKKVYVK